MSFLEEQFLSLWQAYYPELTLEREMVLIPKRKFRFDFVHVPSKTAIEINGGTWGRKKSKHSTGAGIARDYEKANLAAIEGYTVFQLDRKMINLEWVEKIASHILDTTKS